MSTVLGRSLALAFGGLVVGLGLVLALFGVDLRGRWTASPPDARPAPEREDARPLPVLPAPQPARPGSQGAAPPAPPAQAAAPGSPAQGPSTQGSLAQRSVAPSFDVVRVEPNGEAVVAGRGNPDATVELLVDGKAVARTRTDRDGQFALVPPPLAPGSSEIVLRSTDAQGREVRSKQSVAVAVSGAPAAKPLVALTAPDKPTVVLSRPDPVPNAARTAPADKAAPLRIVAVDAQEGGRLFVSSEAQPGAFLRLYLNDTLVVPTEASADGKATFTIGRGVRPGAYRVRIDQVDRETGKVRSRAEVPFTVPELQPRIASRAPDPTPPRATPDAARGEARPVAADGPREAFKDGFKTPAPAPRPETPPAVRTPLPAGAQDQQAPPGPARIAGTRPVPERQAEVAPPAATAPAQSARPAPAAPERPQVAQAAKPDAAQPGDAFVAEISTARITRGDSLWQISRRTYGKGDRYTVIYDANQEQIRNPDLIYPGQIFVLPEDKGGPGQGGRKRG